VDLFRSLNKTAIVLIVLFRLDSPLGECEIAGILDMDWGTVRFYLRSLARQGMVTRSHRFHGWILTAGGRQIVLGESSPERLVARVREETAMVEKPPPPPLAPATLSLNSLSLREEAAAAKAGASAKILRSRLRPGIRKIKKEDRAANGRARSDRMVQANLEAFASIGLVQKDFISGICQMDHVRPDYILGLKRRLEAERRYSGGLLLRVVQCRDDLPEEYVVENPPQPPLIRGEQFHAQLLDDETKLEEEPDPEIKVELDPSIHAPLSPGGMTAARAWSAALRELQTDMPKSAYDKWVRDAVLLSARDETFLIGAQNGSARDWLESRLTSTIMRLLAGSCSRCLEVIFVDISDP
jgi:hypothetical protein